MFPDVTQHPDYLRGQTKEWCEQLAAQTGKYEFTWKYNFEGKNAEDTLTEVLLQLIRGKVIDIGCGHGAYTNRWSELADKVIGYDMTDGFIGTANKNRKSNVEFIIGRTRQGEGLPFPDDYFDVAYTKKGPGSWYKEGNRIVRPGGKVVLYHPGDGNGEGGELGLCFPGLFDPPSVGTPILNVINERLEKSGLTDIQMITLREMVWIPSPEDVFTMRCFGQTERFRQYVYETCFRQVVSLFEKHSSEKGIKLTQFYYLLQAKATEEK